MRKRIYDLMQMTPDRPLPELPPASRWFTPGRFALILLGFLVLSFPKVLFGLESFVYRDYGVLGYPFVSHFHEAFWQGELPLWNPLSNCGAPFMAQWGTMVFYPFSLIHLLLPLPWSLGAFSLGHLFLGGLGIYALARRWTGNPLAASIAGLAYVFNGVTFSSLIWPNYMVALAWMPWLILVTEQGLNKGGKSIVVAGILAALQLAAGVPEIVLMTWFLLGALIIRHQIQEPRSRAIGRALIIVAIGAGLAAIQILPFLDLLTHSQRDASFSSSKWPMPAWGWANLLVPLFRCFETPQGPFFQYGQQFMTSYYLGAGVLVLSVWIALSHRDARVRILAVATLVALIMALGENGFVFSAFKKLLPISSVARYPVKFMILAGFALPLLAAYAVDRLDTRPELPRRPLLIGGVVALVLIALIAVIAFAYPYDKYDQPDTTLKNAIGRAMFLTLMLGILTQLGRPLLQKHALAVRLVLLLLIPLDILTHTANQNPTVTADAFQPGFWQANGGLPAPTPGNFRAFITPDAEAKLLNSSITDLKQDFVGKRLAQWSNLNLLDGIPKINGSSTLQLGYQARVQDLIYKQTNSVPHGLIRFLGASVESSPVNPTEWIPRTNALPFITAGQRPLFANDTNTLEALAGEDFDPQRTVYLPTETQRSVSALGDAPCRILSHQFTPHQITAQVEAGSTSLVVIAQSFYHPWKAYVNDSEVELMRANHAFQALEVPPGNHQIKLIYKDRRFVIGVTITGLTLLACFAALSRRTRT